VRAGDRFRDQTDRVVFGGVLSEVGEGKTQVVREDPRQVEVVDRALLDQELAQPLARRRLL
jgi:hypothetical protein